MRHQNSVLYTALLLSKFYSSDMQISLYLIYILTNVLFLDKLHVKCESFKAIEWEMTTLLEFLERYGAAH